MRTTSLVPGEHAQHATFLPLSASTAKALPDARLVAVGDISGRGIAEPAAVLSVPAYSERSFTRGGDDSQDLNCGLKRWRCRPLHD